MIATAERVVVDRAPCTSCGRVVWAGEYADGHGRCRECRREQERLVVREVEKEVEKEVLNGLHP
tara:strand:+ start:1010 stop:1201 length:192 start_codon:yes stop_codon:yes gene_type:complete